MTTTHWRLQEADRTLAAPDLLTDGLLGRFFFNRVNQLAFSEDLSADPWVRSGVGGERRQDESTGAYIELMEAPVIAGVLSDRWIRFGQSAGSIYQDVAVLPGRIYTYTFYVQPLDDVTKAKFAVTALPSGTFIVNPMSYDSQPVQKDAAGYLRLGVAFRVPVGVTSVRIYALLPADLIQIAVDSASATYQLTRANSVERSTRTISFRGQNYTLATARLRRENE
jgi:hypothetical protein